MRLIFQGEKKLVTGKNGTSHIHSQRIKSAGGIVIKVKGLLLCCNNKEEQAELAFNRFSILQIKNLVNFPTYGESVCLVAKVFWL